MSAGWDGRSALQQGAARARPRAPRPRGRHPDGGALSAGQSPCARACAAPLRQPLPRSASRRRPPPRTTLTLLWLLRAARFVQQHLDKPGWQPEKMSLPLAMTAPVIRTLSELAIPATVHYATTYRQVLVRYNSTLLARWHIQMPTHNELFSFEMVMLAPRPFEWSHWSECRLPQSACDSKHLY